MRAILYAGTRGCSTTLEDALREHLDPVLVVTPAEPRLLGRLSQTSGVQEDVEACARLLLDRGLRQAEAVATRQREALGQVFGPSATTQPPELTARLVTGRLEEGLASLLAEAGAEELWAARELLEILQTVGVDVADGLARQGIELEVR